MIPDASSDVTASLLADAVAHHRECPRSAYAARVVKAAAAKRAEGEVWESLKAKDSDLTLGYLSNVLCYSKFFTSPRFHSAVIRLIKGGFVGVKRVLASPAPGTRAHRESPFSSYYYQLVLKD